MSRTHTHTIATLDVPTWVYDYIERKLRGVAYDHVFLDDGTIDMSGIGLTKGKESRIGSDDPIDQSIDDVSPLLDQCLEKVKSANMRQVGGSHYGGGAIQHWDLAVMFKWNWAQYQITKYVMRYLDKNGLQDLEKAQHFLEKLIEEIKAGRMPEKNS